MIQKKLYDFIRKNWWVTVLLTLSAIGIVFSVWGFVSKCNVPNSFYDTFQLFILHHSFEEGVVWQLEVGRWLIFAVFLWVSFPLFIKILAPEFIKTQIIKRYHDHIVICGLNKITINLIEKFENGKIIVLAGDTNRYAETLKTKGVKLLIGDFADENFWEKAKIKSASQLYAVNENDKINVKIAQTVFSYLEKADMKYP